MHFAIKVFFFLLRIFFQYRTLYFLHLEYRRIQYHWHNKGLGLQGGLHLLMW